MTMSALEWRALVAALWTAAWPLALAMPAAAQQDSKIARVGVLTPEVSDKTPAFLAFRKGLRDLGYVEGKSIVLDFRLAKGHNELLSGFAQELVQIPVDVIVVGGTTAGRAAADITHTIPIVQAAGGDPVAAGLAASLSHPGGNFTGFAIRSDELAGKRLELLRGASPGIRRVTVLLDPSSVVTQTVLGATERAAATLDIQLAKLPVSTPEELAALGPAALAGSNGLVVLPSAMFWNHRATIIALAAAARVPAIYPEREFADDGGLMAYGANIPDTFRRAAGYVDRILRGAKPGDLPIEAVSKFDFIVNLHAARELGLSPSRDFLVGAGEVIE
jgi:putative tryptophan/tyrosine transport system substrate-binding protein